MECVEKCFYDFNPNVLEDVRKAFGLKNKGDMDSAIDVLEAWVQQQNHFLKKDFERHILEKFLLNGKGSLERAKKVLDKFCTVQNLMPKYFADYDFDNEYKELQGVILHCFLPKPTKENYRIFLYKNVGQKFPDNVVFEDARNILLHCSYTLHHDYSAGYIVVADLRSTNLLNLVSKLDIVVLQEVICILFEAYGLRIKAFRVITESKLIDLVLTVFKQVLSKKLYERIHVHRSLEELHEFVPKDVLPEEYGGSEKRSLEELQDEFTKVARSEHEVKLRREMTKAKIDESLRQNHKFVEDYMGTPGSFRTFVVD